MNANQARSAIDEAYNLAGEVLEHIRCGDRNASAETFNRFRSKFWALGDMTDFSAPALGDTDFGAFDGAFAYCYLAAASLHAEKIDRSRGILHKVKRRLDRERWQLIRDHCGGTREGGVGVDPWVLITNLDHFSRSKTTVGRWAKDTKLPWFRRLPGSKRGKYEVLRSRLREYIKPGHRKKYGIE